jgi:phosphate transport system substrate-binding protein
VQPDDSSFRAAAAGAEWEKEAFGPNLNNQAGKDAWPITSATFILMHKVQDKPEQATEVLKFFAWAYASGGKAAGELDYVAIPDAVAKLIEAQWAKTIKDASGKPVAVK